MPVIARGLRLIDLRVDAEVLAVSRIVIGVCAFAVVAESWRSLACILTPLSVPLPYLVPLPRASATVLPLFVSFWFAAATAFFLGFATRLAGALLTGLSAYTLLLDQRTYSNHLYLFVLIVMLLTVADSGAAFSIDARRRGGNSVAAWPVFLLKVQVSLVYGFSALAKLSPQFLSGELLTQTLKTQGWPIIATGWRTPGVMGALAVAVVAMELFIAIGLWSLRLRWFAGIVGVSLHMSILAFLDSSRLSLGIFALEMFALYPLFYEPPARPRHLPQSGQQSSCIEDP